MSKTAWLKRILDEYCEDDWDQHECSQCGTIVMCSFHSLLSLLNRRTFLDEEHAKSFNVNADRPALGSDPIDRNLTASRLGLTRLDLPPEDQG